jgi:hypothetical protein
MLLAMPILAADDESRGMIFYGRFLGSSNTLGNFLRLDTTLGYSFNKYFSIDGGLPVFFVRPSGMTTALAGAKSTNGIGNAYLELRFALANPLVNYSSVVTGSAPTGDKNTGLSTGRATIDFTNRFHRSFSRLTPFGAIGLANTVSDTPLFIRPYTTLGFVTHFEAGGTYRATRFLDAGAAAYAIEPAGRQTVVSELLTKTPAAPAPPGRSEAVAKVYLRPGLLRSARRIWFATTGFLAGAAFIPPRCLNCRWLTLGAFIMRSTRFLSASGSIWPRL